MILERGIKQVCYILLRLPFHEEETTGIVAKLDNMKTPGTNSTNQEGSSTCWFTSGVVGVMEQPINKDVASIPLPNSLKCAAPADFHYADTLLAQSPHQKLRTHQDDTVSSITSSYERPMSSRGVTTAGPNSWSSFTAAHVLPITTSLDNNYPTMKTTYANASCPTGFNCFNESGGKETESKQKAANAVGATKILHHIVRAHNGESSDDMQGQGRISKLTDVVPRMDKIGSVPLRKPTRGMRCNLINDKSKTGGAPPKKQRNRKAPVPSRHHPNDKPSDNTGDFDADHEDLLVAASSVRNAREHACSNPFWKKMERLFAPVTAEDLLFLERQDGARKSSSGREIGNLDQGSVKSSDFGEPKAIETLNMVPSLFQRVLSAFIDEDEGKESYNSNEGTSNTFPCIKDDFHKDRVESEVQSEVDLPFQKYFLVDRLSGSGSSSSNTSSKKGASSTFCNDELQQADGLSFSNAETLFGSDQADQNVLHSTQVNTPIMSSFDLEYQALSLDDKLSLELQSIGLNLGVMPLVDGGEVWIDREIEELQRQLYQQATKVKNSLEKIEAAIHCEQELEKRRIEESAMDQLVQMAYNRIKVRRPIKSSRSCKVSKQAAIDFAHRTLSRCKQFEDSGRSCFSEPYLQDVIFNKTPSEIDVEPADSLMIKKEAGKNAKRKASATGPILGATQKRDCQSDKLRHGSSRLRQTSTQSLSDFMINKEKQELPSHIGGSPSSKAKEVVSLTHPGQVHTGFPTEEHHLSNPYGPIPSCDLRLVKGKMKFLRDIPVSASSEANLTSQLGGIRSERVMKNRDKYGDDATLNSTSGNVYKSKSMSKRKRTLSRIGVQELSKYSQLSTVKPGDPVSIENNESQPPANASQPSSVDALLDDLGLDPAIFDAPNFLEDIDSLLNFDDEGLLDNDFAAGLDVPMDNLSDIEMFV